MSSDPDHHPDPAPRELAGPYLQRHLAGHMPLARSLWINGLLLPLPLALLLGTVDAWTRLHGSLLRLGSGVLLLGWPLLLALLLWGLVGVWRAARREDLYAGSSRWRRFGAPALMGLVLALVSLQAGMNFVPRLLELGALLFWRDPLGAAQVDLSGDGRRLRIKGPIARGDADRVQALVAATPQLQVVIVESSAGRLDEALQIGALVRDRKLPTRASGECSDVCPFIFLAGNKRHLLPAARLGFHRISAGPFNPPHQRWVNTALREQLALVGLTPHMVTKALATPPTTMWFAEADELTAAGLVSLPDRPLDVDLPAPPDASLADYTEALSASPVWQALDRRFQGALAEAAQRMQAASPAGAEAVQAAGHESMAARLPMLLSEASPETRWLFTDILLAQVDFLRSVDPAVCRGLLLGDAAAHRRLPRALAWREAEWLLSALGEARRGTPARRVTALEQEVIRRTLGPRAPAQLIALWRPPAPHTAGEPDCDRALALLSELGSIAAPERRLALRLMYERE